MIPLRTATVAIALLAASCAGGNQTPSIAIQPQNVDGPCTVKSFFIENLTATHTDMTVRNTGQACTFTVFNPTLQVFVTAAQVTTPAAHGTAQAYMTEGRFQGAASYTPQPGYVGTDHFTVTFEPQARAVDLAVTVRPATP